MGQVKTAKSCVITVQYY